jgi:hypothetical protein
MAAFSAYFDTAGTEAEGTILVAVGLVATVHAWENFDGRWKAVLKKFKVSSFHMKDFAHSKGEYEHWKGDEKRRRRFIASLVQTLNRLTKGFVRGVVLEDFRATDFRYQLKESVGGPYSLAQAACIGSIIDSLMAKFPKSADEPFNWYVERGDAGQPEFRKFLRREWGIEPSFIPRIDPTSGEAYTPLLAADLIAYEHRLFYRRAYEVGSLPRHKDRRGSLNAIRRTIAIDPKVADRGFMKRFCEQVNVPLREVSP